MTPTLFRPNQYEIMRYNGGKMAVSAVPGAGKTFTLSHLAAQLVSRLTHKSLTDVQEVLIVTFSNSAVNSLKARIADIVQEQRGLLPYVGYRVRTLHGLAHDIVRERPSLVGLAEDFKIVDERVSQEILQDAVDAWIRASGDSLLMPYIDPDMETEEATMRRIRSRDFPDTAFSVAAAFIRQTKDRLLTPAMLRDQLEQAKRTTRGFDLPLAVFGLEVYEAYTRSLVYRGAVDFDDLVRLALAALHADEGYLRRLQKRWPFILEDEAQDSSLLQEHMLRLLSHDRNWVRVGDPNQAINTTFTTANPQYLRNFLTEVGVKTHTLAEAGRSAVPIINLANYLVKWTTKHHPINALHNTFYPQDILPAPPGDTQPNPNADASRLHIQYEAGKAISPEDELILVANSLEKWLPANLDKTCAVLVPENKRGYKLAELLRDRGIPYEELLRSTTATRDAADKLRMVLTYLASPMESGKLTHLYRDLWWGTHLGADVAYGERNAIREDALTALNKNRTVETFLFPRAGQTPFDALDLKSQDDVLIDDLDNFRQIVNRWLQATSLPIDQLVLTIGQDLFTSPVDIALCYKIAQVMRGMASDSPDWRLPQFTEELRKISQNERRFIGFDDAAEGYTPRCGMVTIATMHAAKGLEWDRVYLMAINNYSFPAAQSYDSYISERRFVRNRLNLEAEIVAQLEALQYGRPYVEGKATEQARLEYSAERLRLLYVGITRAREELIITWNTGHSSQSKDAAPIQPALALVALSEYQRRQPVTKNTKA